MTKRKNLAIHDSICTGGQAAGLMDPAGGRFQERIRIRNSRVLQKFLQPYQAGAREIERERMDKYGYKCYNNK